MPQPLFNTSHVLRRLAEASPQQPVRQEIAARLAERLAEVKGSYTNVLNLTEEALSPAFQPPLGPFDAVTANLLLPVVEDVPVFMVKALQSLRPDGLLLATTLGLESFREFRAAWAEVGQPQGHVIPLTDVREAGALLQRLKLALPVVDRDVMTLTFPNFATLYANLRGHGTGNFNAARQPGLTTPHQFRAMEEAYTRLFARPDGRLPLTLEVIYLHGFKPSENQPKSKKPGTGQISLVRILGETP